MYHRVNLLDIAVGIFGGMMALSVVLTDMGQKAPVLYAGAEWAFSPCVQCCQVVDDLPGLSLDPPHEQHRVHLVVDHLI
jgi:hypothetical protein